MLIGLINFWLINSHSHSVSLLLYFSLSLHLSLLLLSSANICFFVKHQDEPIIFHRLWSRLQSAVTAGFQVWVHSLWIYTFCVKWNHFFTLNLSRPGVFSLFALLPGCLLHLCFPDYVYLITGILVFFFLFTNLALLQSIVHRSVILLYLYLYFYWLW